MIAESDAVKQIEDWLTLRCQSVNHRQIFLLCGDEEWQQTIAESTIDGFNKHYNCKLSCPWYGERLSGEDTLSTHPNQLIGQQTALVTINALERLLARQLLVLAGTIEHQGLLIVLCPPLNDWQQSWSFLAKQSYGVETTESNFAAYFREAIFTDTGTAIIDQFTGKVRLPLARLSQARPDSIDHLPFASREQHSIGQELLASLGTTGNHIISLTAKRGRGKTWLMGWLCRELITAGKKVAVISSRASALQPLFAQTDISNSAGNLSFYAPDALNFDEASCDLLLIDEAASIPIPVLLKLCNARCNCILSTTVDGYEGTGQGYLNRLLPEVQSRYQGFNELSLQQPLRWQESDSLERLLDNIFFLTTDMPTPQKLASGGNVDYFAVSKEQLLNEPNLLEQVYTLLKLAHYQTTADDLIRLLDCPDQSLYIARSELSVEGVMLVIEEGNAQVSALSNEISSGQRRVAGHMSLQLSSFEAREPAFCALRLLRINRIAVAKQHRRQGIASGLIEFLRKQATRLTRIDALTTIFGSQPELEHFWQNTGFSFHYRGRKTNKASNAENVLYVLPISNNGKHCFVNNKRLTTAKHKAKIKDFIAGYRTLLHCRDSFAWLREQANQKDASSILLKLELTPKKLQIRDFFEFGITTESELKTFLAELVNQH